MLQTHHRRVPPPSGGLDPIALLSVVLLSLVAVGLLAAAILAVYDWTTPAIEGPVVAAISGVFGLALILNVVAVALRAPRRA